MYFIIKIYMEYEITCKIVSKLNVKPFQSVNSPLDEPVINLLPSGVHYKNKLLKY